MKRAVILILMAALLLTGCAAEPSVPQEPYTQYVGNTQFFVDPTVRTITANGRVYVYEYHENGVNITYPNGAVCTESNGAVTWYNADVDFITNNGGNYMDCFMLLTVVPEQTQEKEHVTMWFLILCGMVIIGVGVWLYTCPRVLWKWKYGWRYSNAEPSDTGLAVIMASGILNIILGIVLILIGIFT